MISLVIIPFSVNHKWCLIKTITNKDNKWLLSLEMIHFSIITSMIKEEIVKDNKTLITLTHFSIHLEMMTIIYILISSGTAILSHQWIQECLQSLEIWDLCQKTCLLFYKDKDKAKVLLLLKKIKLIILKPK